MTDKINVYMVLADVQAKLNAPKGQYNSHGNYRYRSCEDILEAVKPLILPYGYVVLLSDELEQIGDRYYIKATATLTNGVDAQKVSAYAREAISRKGMDESQITGAASSYARKYALDGLFSIDDAKDADTDSYDRQTACKQTKLPFCEECGHDILPSKTRTAEQMAAASKAKFGRALCVDCANNELAGTNDNNC